MNPNKIVVLGGGESGVGAALLARAKGFEVFLSDKSTLQDHYRRVLLAENILFEEGTHTEEHIMDAAEVVKSPGIPDNTEIIQKLKVRNIPVVSEIEFAARYTRAKIIAITGSNGKTTTTLLTHHLLKSAGLNVGLAGNVGKSFAELVVEDKFDWYVLEVSSFQLDNCHDFHPHIAILTNITPDHLDRYAYRFENYIASKFRIIQVQQASDFFIYNALSESVTDWIGDNFGSVQHLVPQAVPVMVADHLDENTTRQMPRLGYADSERIASVWDGETMYFTGDEIVLKGKHNTFNALCAIQTCRILGISEEKIKAGLQTFENAPHRLEKVAEIKGITFINDSKATNVDSVFYALDSFKQPVIWIAGGVDKGNDYTQIEELATQKVKALICLGKDNAKLVSFFGGKVPVIRETQDIREAVAIGLELGQPGDVVLLSPACASFDLFCNYEDRGEQFRQAVLDL